MKPNTIKILFNISTNHKFSSLLYSFLNEFVSIWSYIKYVYSILISHRFNIT